MEVGNWTVVLLGILTAFCFKMWWSRRRLRELASKIQGPPPLPLIGNINLLLASPDVVFSRIRGLKEKYEGHPFRLWAGSRLCVFITTPEDAEIILVKHKLLERDKFITYFVRSLFGNGLLLSDPVTWKHEKKMISPAFQPKVLQTYIDIFNRNNRVLEERLKNFADEKPFDLNEVMMDCALDNLCESILGTKADKEEEGSLGKLHVRVVTIPVLRLARPWLHIDALFWLSALGKEQKQIEETIFRLPDAIINKKYKEYSENKLSAKDSDEDDNKRKSILDHMLSSLKDGEDTWMSEQQLKDEVRTLLMAGSDTVSITLSFMFMFLALHPELQERIYQELEEVFGDDWERPITYEDMKQLDLLKRCMKETMRMVPPIVFLPRETNEEIQLSTCTLPAGCSAWILPMAIHQDKRYYPDFLSFNPDRFLPERIKERHPYSYIPFGAGPRMCIGFKYAEIEMIVIAAHVFKKYRILPMCTFDEIMQLDVALVLKPKCGFKVKLSPR